MFGNRCRYQQSYLFIVEWVSNTCQLILETTDTLSLITGKSRMKRLSAYSIIFKLREAFENWLAEFLMRIRNSVYRYTVIFGTLCTRTLCFPNQSVQNLETPNDISVFAQKVYRAKNIVISFFIWTVFFYLVQCKYIATCCCSLVFFTILASNHTIWFT